MAIKKRDEAIEEFERKVKRLENNYREVKKENKSIKEYLYILSSVLAVVIVLLFVANKFTGNSIADFSGGTLLNASSESVFSHVTISSDAPYSGGTVPSYCEGTAIGAETDCSIYSNPADQTDCQNNHPGCTTSNDGDCSLITAYDDCQIGLEPPASNGKWGCVWSEDGYGGSCSGTWSSDCLGTIYGSPDNSCTSEALQNQGSCEGQNGCTWNPEGVGSLKAYYPFDGDKIWNSEFYTINDYTSNNYNGVVNDGTSNNGVDFTDGKYGRCANFSGGYIDTGNYFAYNVYTISLWFNADSNPSVAGLLSNGRSGGSYHTMYLASNHVSFGGLYFAAFDNTNTEVKLYPNPGIVPTTEGWHNIIIVKGLDTLEMYYDGSGVASVSITSTLASPTNNLLIGQDGYGNYFDGKIDDLMIFNYALSAQQISDIYTEASPRFTATSGTHTFDIDLGTNTTTNITLGDYVVPSGTMITAQMTIGGTVGAGPMEVINGVINDYAIPTGSGTSGTLTLTYNTDANRFLSPIAGGNITLDAWGAPEPVNSNAPARAHWKMNDNEASATIIDSSGNSHTCSLQAQTTDVLTTTGKINSALDNTATSDYAVCDASDIWRTTPFTITFWTQGTGHARHWLGMTSGAADSWRIEGADNPYFVTDDIVTAQATTNYNDGGWHMMVATMDETGYIQMYTDGNLEDTNQATPSTVVSDTMQFWKTGGDATMPMALDDVRFYNYTLNSTQIAFLYNSGSGTEDDFSGNGLAADTNAPAIFIISPQQNSNHSTRILALNYSVFDDIAMGSCWYSFDAGVTPSPAQVCGTNWTGLEASEGDNRLTFYANDTTGNTNSTDVFFYVDSLAPNTNFTNPTSSGTISGDSIYVNLTTSDASNHYSFVDFDRSLVGWWRGEGNDLDELSLHNGTLTGNANASSTGKFNTSFGFDGTGDYVVTNNNIGISGANLWTMSAWVKTNTNGDMSAGGTTNQNIVSIGQAALNNQEKIVSIGAINQTRAQLNLWSVSPGNINFEVDNYYNNFINIVATYNGTTLRAYSNGVLVLTNSRALNLNDYPAYIGGRPGNSNGQYFNGYIDDVLIFNRSLSASEIASLYNAQANQYEKNFTSLSVGSHTITGYAVDIFGNKNSTETRTVTISAPADTTSPSISLVYPTNTTYNSVITELNYVASDETALGSCWYSLNGGANSTAQTCNTNWTGLEASEGDNRWTVYANDTTGNTNSTDVFFYVDTIYPTISVTSPSNITYNSSSSMPINFTSSDETLISSKWFYNGTGNTTYTDVVTQVLADGQYTFIFYTNDSSNNVNSTSVTFAISTANTGLPSCLDQCNESEGCVIASACHLDSSMCSGGICQFTNLTISAQLKTGTNDSGTAKDLAINITSNATSPVLFLAGGAINFSGSAGAVGGSAGIVNITVYNLFNTTSAFFYGTGGASTTSANGGNGGILQINAHGVIRWFSDDADSGEVDPSNWPDLSGGSSNGGGDAGIDNTIDGIIFNKDIVRCPRDQDITSDGHVAQGDAVTIGTAYNYRNGEALYTQTKDINCDSNLNVIELSRIGLQFNTR